MNDAGDKINQYVPRVPRDPQDATGDWANLDASRWWFASAAFPIIAGTLGPVASAFSVCALVKPWRQSFPPGTNLESAPYVNNPAWLTVINAVQLAIALLANMVLFLNMTRRLSFTIAQPITIVGWYISSLALVALTATASGPLVIEPADQFIWSQAFFYGVYAAVLYFLVASLMVVTCVGARTGRYPKDFTLTAGQRTLMLQTIILLLDLLLGALVFCKIEDWNYLDAVYWAAVTIFTVGFGDIHPTTTLGRSLLMPYALVGIINLGLVIGSIRSLVLDRRKIRLGARIVEKKRRRTIQRMSRTGKDDILVPIKDGLPTLSSVRTDSSALTEFDRRRREFRLMRKIQDAASRRCRWVDMGVSTGTWLALWLAGARVFEACEARYQGWTYFDAFYFAFVSFTTIGYGDETPVSNAGRSFWVFWALLALPTMTVLISNAVDTIVKCIRDTTDQIATVTILPSEAGFKKDLRRLLHMLSFGVLYEEYIEPEAPGLLGRSQRLKRAVTEDNNQDDEADLEAEGASAATTKQKRADRQDFEDGHTGPSAGETSSPSPNSTTFSSTNKNRITFSNKSPPPSHPHSRAPPPKPHTRRPSVPYRQPLPPSSTTPASQSDYHITLIDEIRRVTQDLKCQPPRKYTFREWAWYLRLIGEDEDDAERHPKACVKVKQATKHARFGRLQLRPGGGNTAAEADAQDGTVTADGDGNENGKGKATGDGREKYPENKQGERRGKQQQEEEADSGPLGWSWVGSNSPLIGSQEEAEWILERLTARLGQELRASREGHQQ
ncbi:hypothetical protein GE09DRAFT_1231200 [Coniochaeta sp. 2T2.1]|nr:hypothetical protein GE09DRAFT_1231200 [Coniochaeta sp. 2T2.1]